MALAIGVTLAIGVGLLGKYAGFDRDRAFYSTIVIVVASYYVLFAAMTGSLQTVAAESAVMMVFLIAAVTGFRWSQWIVAAALFGHGLLDAVHAGVIVNHGVPAWWPAFCGAFDVVAAGWLAAMLWRR